MFEGSCHCGAVKLSITDPPGTLTECNCSVCRQLGVRWAYYHPDQVRLTGETRPYAWGDRMLEFHHCPECGCTTHWQSTTPVRAARMAVNARLFDPAEMDGIRIRRFDGADSWTYLD